MDIKFLFIHNFASNNFPQMQYSVDETIGDFVSSRREKPCDKKKTYFLVSILFPLPMAGLQCHAIKNKNHNHSMN